MTTRSIGWAFLATTILGCGYTSRTEVGDAAVADGGACAIEWIDDAPLARTRTRFVDPVITGDGDGFLFVTTGRAPDLCEDVPCVIVARLASSGDGSDVTRVDAPVTSDRISLHAGTDEAGDGHFAVTATSEAHGLVWGSAPPRDETAYVTLDPSRGIAAVAFERDAVRIVTHEWMSEGTIGEGHSYPIAPRILRSDVEGVVTEVGGPDASEGVLFIDTTLALTERGGWMVASGFYGGPLRAAGSGWSGTVHERAQGGWYDADTDRDGAIVVADTYEGALRVVRVGADGAREETTIDADAHVNVAIARSGERLVVAYRTSAGTVRVAVLDASLTTIASADARADTSVSFPVVDVAAATDGTFALMVAPFPASTDHTAAEPVEIRRFRMSCE